LEIIIAARLQPLDAMVDPSEPDHDVAFSSRAHQSLVAAAGVIDLVAGRTKALVR
jgi:hypothetical protein